MGECPQWSALERRRDLDPEAWQQAVEHLDGCSCCRREALVVDPTLVFQRLPRLEVNAAIISDMQRAVAARRRVEHLEPPRRTTPRWLRGVAAASVLVSALLLQGAMGKIAPGGDLASSAGAGRENAAFEIIDFGLNEPLPMSAAVPLVEELQSAGQMIHLIDSEMDLVLVLSEEGLEPAIFEQGFDV